jgi:octaprenyl-diphosphate synthase
MRPPLVPLAEVTERVGLEGLSSQLNDLRGWLDGDVAALESQIDALVSRSEPAVPGNLARRAAAHLLARPGKRIRPLCVMLGARLGSDVAPHDATRQPHDCHTIRDLAIAAELVHAATLLHDDVIDEGTERRGETATRMVFGNSASILAGDYLLIEALGRVRRAGEAVPGGGELLSSLLDTIAAMVSAEAEQLERRGRFEPDREAYLRIIGGKTASLFRWALGAGARAAGLSASQVTAVDDAGTALGLAFQLIDDVLDLEADACQLGKDLFADLAQGKLTWPLIVACETQPGLTAEFATLYAQADSLDPQAAQHFIEQLRASGAIEATRRFAREQHAIAMTKLATLPNTRGRRALSFIIQAAVERSR